MMPQKELSLRGGQKEKLLLGVKGEAAAKRL